MMNIVFKFFVQFCSIFLFISTQIGVKYITIEFYKYINSYLMSHSDLSPPLSIAFFFCIYSFFFSPFQADPTPFVFISLINTSIFKIFIASHVTLNEFAFGDQQQQQKNLQKIE
jgi:hypothetical protein